MEGKVVDGFFFLTCQGKGREGEFHHYSKETNCRAVSSGPEFGSQILMITYSLFSQSLHVALNVGVDLLWLYLTQCLDDLSS